jgi:hypothetical protein
VLSDNGHGPQQNGQPQNTKSKNQQTDIEELIFEHANFLKNKERIIQLELPVPCGSFFEADVLLTVWGMSRKKEVSNGRLSISTGHRHSVRSS